MASLAVMRDLVSTGYAPYYNLLWRTSTLYVTALAGFACLAVALLQDARRAMRPTWKQPNARTGFPPADTLAPTPSRDCLHSADDPHSAAAGRHQSRGPDQGVELPLRMRRRRALWLVILTMASVMTPGCAGVARPIPEVDGRWFSRYRPKSVESTVRRLSDPRHICVRLGPPGRSEHRNAIRTDRPACWSLPLLDRRVR
jgi:hypothetical protein